MICIDLVARIQTPPQIVATLSRQIELTADIGFCFEGEGTSFFPDPDEQAETVTHFYFGWASINGGWLIRRQDRVTLERRDVTGVDDFAGAWGNREGLGYDVS